MAVHSGSFLPHPRILPAKSGFPSLHFCRNRWTSTTNLTGTGTTSASISISGSRRNSAGGAWVRVSALDRSNSGSSNYVVPLDASSCITRPLAEILRDLNKRIPDNIIINNTNTTFIPWYHANRMLSFYAPGWCGEVRDVIFSDNGSVTVVYRVTIRGSDGELGIAMRSTIRTKPIVERGPTSGQKRPNCSPCSSQLTAEEPFPMLPLCSLHYCHT